MKKILATLVLFLLIGCTKEKESSPIVGSWRLTQIRSGDSSTIYLSGTELSVEFREGGRFKVLGPNPNYTFLQDFNRYETLNAERIRFFDSTSGGELFAVFHVDNTLSLSYELRCPYEEKFTRR